MAVAADSLRINSIQYNVNHLEYKYYFITTTAAPATCIQTCKEVQLGASAKRQRVTEAKAVSVAVYVSENRLVSGAVIARRGETPREYWLC